MILITLCSPFMKLYHNGDTYHSLLHISGWSAAFIILVCLAKFLHLPTEVWMNSLPYITANNSEMSIRKGQQMADKIKKLMQI